MKIFGRLSARDRKKGVVSGIQNEPAGFQKRVWSAVATNLENRGHLGFVAETPYLHYFSETSFGDTSHLDLVSLVLVDELDETHTHL